MFLFSIRHLTDSAIVILASKAVNTQLPTCNSTVRYAKLDDFTSQTKVQVTQKLCLPKTTCKVLFHDNGLALLNDTEETIVLQDVKICGFGVMSVVLEVDSSKFGSGKEISFTLPSAMNANAVKVLLRDRDTDSSIEKYDTVLNHLATAGYDHERPDLALYGHHGTKTPTGQLILKSRAAMVGKSTAEKPKSAESNLDNAGLLLGDQLNNGFKIVTVLKCVRAPEASLGGVALTVIRQMARQAFMFTLASPYTLVTLPPINNVLHCRQTNAT